MYQQYIGGMKNAPGKWSIVPYTSSATLQLRSSLSAVWIPNKTNGRKSAQLSG